MCIWWLQLGCKSQRATSELFQHATNIYGQDLFSEFMTSRCTMKVMRHSWRALMSAFFFSASLLQTATFSSFLWHFLSYFKQQKVLHGNSSIATLYSSRFFLHSPKKKFVVGGLQLKSCV